MGGLKKFMENSNAHVGRIRSASTMTRRIAWWVAIVAGTLGSNVILWSWLIQAWALSEYSIATGIRFWTSPSYWSPLVGIAIVWTLLGLVVGRLGAAASVILALSVVYPSVRLSLGSRGQIEAGPFLFAGFFYLFALIFGALGVLIRVRWLSRLV